MKATSFDPGMLDRYLASNTPVIAVSHGAHSQLAIAGHRYLVAREGLFVEVARPWVHAVLSAGPAAVALPFGSAQHLAGIELRCGQVPAKLLSSFLQQAQRALPNECGAWIVWHEETKAFQLIELKAIEATADRLNYERPKLDLGWHLVVDLHSHGKAGAFFSSTDDQDDGQSGEVKVAGVVGNVDGTPQWCFRFAACGLFEELPR